MALKLIQSENEQQTKQKSRHPTNPTVHFIQTAQDTCLV